MKSKMIWRGNTCEGIIDTHDFFVNSVIYQREKKPSFKTNSLKQKMTEYLASSIN